MNSVIFCRLWWLFCGQPSSCVLLTPLTENNYPYNTTEMLHCEGLSRSLSVLTLFFNKFELSNSIVSHQAAFEKGASSWDFGTYHTGDQQRLRWDCASAQPARLCICTASPEPSLFAHIKYGNRRRVRSKIRHLAPLDGCVCEFTEDGKYRIHMTWLKREIKK